MIVTDAPQDPPTKPLPRQPLNRDVARPVANLGNTCYMNAVLQALAHAPELCMAMDVEPHCNKCPIYTENAQKRRSSPSSSPEGPEVQVKPTGTRKSRRSGRSPTQAREDVFKFCALCEVEQHLNRVHTSTNNREKPVAPSMFVNGFIGHVAPWFRLGQQEDSHEFLRLLIDAMQRSCQQARPSHENPQDTPPEKTPQEEEKEKTPDDMEYPFQLFRGTVESNVTCESCKSTSSTMDPIEDIGLDVTPTSSTSSPGQLADVGTALQRFARVEALDSGYKCEKCGKLGKATKQSRLAAIPPILTLHLKRFRYGETQKASMGATQSTRRSNRSSEVSQLLGSSGGDFFSGKSGSAKIEGHSKFEQILDLKPYLTEEMQAKHSKMFCRLFAVIVHAGKNSHSGHYIAYVRNIAKNEWWKMDDARITVASANEVISAKAYMLFYRVVDHPFAVELRTQAKKQQDEYLKEMKEMEKEKDEESKEVPPVEDTTTKVEAPEPTAAMEEDVKPESPPSPPAAKTDDSTGSASKQNGGRSNHRKRKSPEFTCGEDWAKNKTTLPDHMAAKFRDVEATISEYVQFKPEFFRLLTEQASKTNAKVGHGPSSGICGASYYELKASSFCILF
jgi:ubiquitin C-terminal hydrolase